MYTVTAAGFNTSNVNELFAYVEFCKQYRQHVQDACERILRIAFERFRKSDKPAGHPIAWTLDAGLEKLRSPERRAEFEREWAGLEAA